MNNALVQFIKTASGKPWTYRLKIKNESIEDVWSKNITQPTDNYIDVTEQGPYALSEIEWIEINPVQLYQAGRLTPAKEIDHTKEITALLNDLKIEYSLQDRMIRFGI